MTAPGSRRPPRPAVVKGQYPRAVALLRGLAALRPKDPSPAYRLAEVYTLAGQYEEAIGEYRRFAARPEADPARKARAEAEAKRLEEAPAPFAESSSSRRRRRPKPSGSSKRARRTRRPSSSSRAINELQAALLLDPDLPGPYRLLGAVYGKTGDRAQERLFLADYLRVRPDGKIADTVRATLQGARARHASPSTRRSRARSTSTGARPGKTTPLKKLRAAAGQVRRRPGERAVSHRRATCASTSRRQGHREEVRVRRALDQARSVGARARRRQGHRLVGRSRHPRRQAQHLVQEPRRQRRKPWSWTSKVARGQS